MFEIPEYVTLACQMSESISGKRIAHGTLSNSPHKFVWYNRKPAEFAAIVKGKTIGIAYSKGRWLFITLVPGYLLVFGECGGKILLHDARSNLPEKYHLSLTFEDGSSLSATTQMWGAMEVFEKRKELERHYIKGMRPTPIDPTFSADYLATLIEECKAADFMVIRTSLEDRMLQSELPGYKDYVRNVRYRLLPGIW